MGAVVEVVSVVGYNVWKVKKSSYGDRSYGDRIEMIKREGSDLKKKVIVAGHICLDITPIFPDKKVQAIEDMLSPGKLIEMKGVDVHTGGAVANTGLGMKLLGADVSLMGKVGTDEFGAIICNLLKNADAADGMIVSPEESTSYSVVLAVPGIDRIFLHNPGANHTFCAEDVQTEHLEEAALFHFGYPPIMKTIYAENGKELELLFRKAKAAGCATSLDMAAVDPGSDAANADWDEIIKRVLPFVDFFVPSVEELCYMIDRERFVEWQKRAGGRDLTEVLDIATDVVPLADKCMEYGAKVLVIKCGAAGMYYRTAGAEQMRMIGGRTGIDVMQWANRQGFEHAYVPEKVLSGTGAGDTSIAAFLTAMLEGDSPENCMHLAAAAGASCVAAYDALSGIRPLAELRAKIASGWKKVNEG